MEQEAQSMLLPNYNQCCPMRSRSKFNEAPFCYIQNQMSESRPGTRSLSLHQKRDLMWNIIEPGDPYDIRKSMIAKLPGQSRPMGPHLELVCLLQAAEIERLCQCLEQNRMKLRQSERISLDRHSYQVQIKELSEKASHEDILRNQVDKLKQFIRRQGVELQELQRQQSRSELQIKYEESLKQVQSILAQNNMLKEDLRQFQSQVHQQQASDLRRSSQFHQLQSANRNLVQQLQRQRSQHSHLPSTLQQYQNRYNMLVQQIDRLNGVLRDKARQVTQQTNRNRQLIDDLRHRDEMVNENGMKIRHLEQTISTLQKQQREYTGSLTDLEKSKNIIQTYQSSLQKFSLEVDRLNNVLHKKVAQLEQAKRKSNELEGRVREYEAGQRQNEEVKVKFGEVNRKISHYEQRIAQLTQDYQRVGTNLTNAQQDLHASEGRNHTLKKEIERLKDVLAVKERQHQDSSGRKSEEPSAPIPVIGKAESRFQSGAEYISSLINQNKAFQEQIQGLIGELNEKKGRIEELQEQNGQLMAERMDLKGLTRDYQRRIQELNQANIHRRSEIKPQVQKQFSDNPYTITGSQKDSPLQKAYEELSNQHQLLQIKCKQLQNQKQVWNIKLDNLQKQQQKKLAQYEQKLSQALAAEDKQGGRGSEVVEIANRLNAKTNQYNRLLSEFRKLQQVNASSEEEIQRLRQNQGTTPGGFLPTHRRDDSRDSAAGNLQIELAQLNEAYTQMAMEKEELEQRVEEAGHYYDKVLVFSEEIERLNANLRRKEGEYRTAQATNQGHLQAIASHQRTIDKMKQELEWLSCEIQPKNQQIYQLKQQVQEWQDKYWNECREREAVEGRLKTSREGGQQLEEIADKQNFYHEEVGRLNGIIKQQLEELEEVRVELGGLQAEQRAKARQREDKDHTIARLEERLEQTCSEVERLSGLLEEKTSALVALDVQYAQHRHQQQNKIHELTRSLQQSRSSYEQLKREMIDVQSQSKLKQLKMSSMEDYEVKLQQLSREVQRLNELLIGHNITKQQQQSRNQQQMLQLQSLNRKLKEKDQDALSVHQQITHLNGVIDRLKGECQDERSEKNRLKERLRESQSQIATYRQQIKQYSQKINELHNEFERMQDLLRNIKAENTQHTSHIDELVAKNRYLGGEVDRLNSELSVTSEDASQLRSSVSSHTALQNRIREHLSLFVVLFAEIESLRKLVGLREEELVRVRAEAVGAHRV